jgi:hypothetical protein
MVVVEERIPQILTIAARSDARAQQEEAAAVYHPLRIILCSAL